MRLLTLVPFAALALQDASAKPTLGRRDIQQGKPDPAPPGYEQWISPLVLPSPPQDGSQGWADAVKKAKAFVAKLTLEEKVNLTTGVGATGKCVGNTGAVPRLKFDGICLQDSPLGVRLTDKNSVFPAAINAAATFDPDLIYARAHAMGQEFRGKGINVALGPMTNLARAPEGGRIWEGFGADPYLSGVGTALSVRGIQANGVSACVKHFAGNEQEHFRGGGAATASSSNIDDRTMHEVYDWPFQEGVHAGATYIMCSYNRLNQTYSCQNSKLLNGIMKGESGFQGAIVSDWAAINEGVDAALAGTDMNMPGFTAYGVPDDQHDPSKATNSYWGAALVRAVRNGSVPEARLNDMVTRTMSAFYKLGQDKNFPAVNFQTQPPSGPPLNVPWDKHVDVQDDHYKVIREIGSASTVLLKNTKRALPLRSPKKLRRLAVIGSDAGDNPAGPNACGDRGCDNGTLAIGWGSGTANFPYLISPLTAITKYVKAQKATTKITSVLDDGDHASAAKAASQADTTLVFVNSDSGEGYITVDGNAGDRNNLSLWHDGDGLIKAAASASSNVVVIVHAVGPVDMEKWIAHPNVTAVLWAGLPGQESGNSIVDVLWGKVNPSGRLPFTIGKRRGDYPADVLYDSDMTVPQITYSEGLDIDYRHFDSAHIKPRFEFGFGLSYTSFKYSGLSFKFTRDPKAKDTTRSPRVTTHSWLWQEVADVTFTITNTGSVSGYEVPQLYLSFPNIGEPKQVLRGFARPFLKSSESRKVSLTLRRKDISIWSIRLQDWVIPDGQFTVHVGSSSRLIHLTNHFRI